MPLNHVQFNGSQPAYAAPHTQTVLNNATVTASSSAVYTNFGSNTVLLIVNIKISPTGSSPTIDFEIDNVDPIDGSTSLQNSVSTGNLNSTGVSILSLQSVSSSIKVSWTVGGSSPSFTGVNVTLIQQSSGNSVDVTPLIPVATDYLPVRLSNGTSFYNASGGPGGGTSTYGAALPADGTAVGFSDGTNMQAARVFDADSGGGSQYVLGVNLRKSASGGSAEFGTSSDPIRVDPTGSTTQPVSGTVTANAGTGNFNNSSVSSTGAAISASATEIGVSDGTNLQVPRAFDVDTGGGTQYVLGINLRKAASGGSVEAGTASDPIRVDPTGSTTQPVSGTVTANAGTGNFNDASIGSTGSAVPASASMIGGSDGTNLRAIRTASDGTVRVDPTGTTTQPVSGTVTANAGTGVFDVTPASPAANDYLPVRLTDGSSFYTAGSTSGSSSFGTVLFRETFDGFGLDRQQWVLESSSFSSTISGGYFFLNSNTTTSAYLRLISRPRFRTVGEKELFFQAAVELETTSPSNVHRFWGFGTDPTTYGIQTLTWTASATPVRDGIGFEVDTSGQLRASIYKDGTRTFTQTLSWVSADGIPNLFAISYKDSEINWYIDDTSTALATNTDQTDFGQTELPVRFHTINHTVAPGASPALHIRYVSVSDRSQTNVTIADGNYPWRKVRINDSGSISVRDESANTIFNETWDGSSLNITKWISSSSGGTITYSAGAANISLGTSNSIYRSLETRTNFQPTGTDLIIAEWSAASTAVPNTATYFGFFSRQSSPTTAAPITEGWAVEINTSGLLRVALFSNGVRIATYIPKYIPYIGAPNSPIRWKIVWSVIKGIQVYAAENNQVEFGEPIIMIHGVSNWATSTQAFPFTVLTVNSSSAISTGNTLNMFALSVGTTRKETFTAPSSTPSPHTTALIGGVSGGIIRAAKSSRVGHIRPGYDTLLAYDPIEGSTVNSWLWAQSVSIQSITQASGLLNINNTAATNNTTHAIITSNRKFQLMDQGVLKLAFRGTIASNPGNNAWLELGFGAPTTTTAIISDGAFFRFNNSSMSCVWSYNGTETSSSVSLAPSTLVNNYYSFLIYLEEDSVRYIIESSTGIPVVDVTIQTTITTPDISLPTHLPAFIRTYNGTGAVFAGKFSMSSFSVIMMDINSNKLWTDQLGSSGRTATLDPNAFTQTHALANAAAATAITPNNTGSTAYTTLGGEYRGNATAASENILSLFAYTVPSPHALVIKSIQIPAPVVTGVAVATAAILEWFIAYNASSVNLSTATGLIRVPIGMHTAAASAAVGTVFNGGLLKIDFTAPIYCHPGTVFHIGYKVINGAATANLVYRGTILVDGYFE
jgi:hypothetical protein